MQMNNMLAFMTGILEAIAEFLSTEPIIYIVGFILGSVTIKIVKDLMKVG